MALSGVILVGFVIGHMAGNLQMFLPPEYINRYAYKLQSLGPLLWGIRLFLLFCVFVHILTAILLVKENRAARPQKYVTEKSVQASFSSRVMPMSGLIVLFFLVYHLLHYTVKFTHPEFKELSYKLPEVPHLVHDVYSMVAVGFSAQYWYISIFYILATGLLCSHLSHGISSMFQSLGFRNEKWRYRLNRSAIVSVWVIFIGFAILPIAGLLGWIKPLDAENFANDYNISKKELP